MRARVRADEKAMMIRAKKLGMDSEKRQFKNTRPHVKTCMICRKRRHGKVRFSNGYEGAEACSKCCFLLILKQIGSRPITLKNNLPKAVIR